MTDEINISEILCSEHKNLEIHLKIEPLVVLGNTEIFVL